MAAKPQHKGHRPHVAIEHSQGVSSELKRAVSVNHTPDFKDLLIIVI